MYHVMMINVYYYYYKTVKCTIITFFGLSWPQRQCRFCRQRTYRSIAAVCTICDVYVVNVTRSDYKMSLNSEPACCATDKSGRWGSNWLFSVVVVVVLPV